MRVLILSHGHPDYSIGGAEVASFTLFNAFRERTDVDAHYLARAPGGIRRHPDTPMMSLRHSSQEIFYHAGQWDEFWLSNNGLTDLAGPFSDYLRRLAPDVVHFHHVIGFGVEAIAAARRALPDATVLITFHEFLPMCANHGQMIKFGKSQLCNVASPSDCSLCIQSRTSADFFVREEHVRRHLMLADGFISPSHFLRRRYEAWGLPESRFFTLENGVAGTPVAPRPAIPGARRDRFGFFGQISEFKGLHIVLDAIARIPDEMWQDATFSVFGGNLEHQPESFRARFAALMDRAGPRARFYGSYRQSELPGLMADIDWVIMPSIWWENSPVVIQEAFLHRRPLIVSGIGGMAEKVRHDLDGLHFRAGSPESLADQLRRALSDSLLWQRLLANSPTVVTPAEMAEAHLSAYAAVSRRKSTTNTTSYRSAA